MHSLRGPCGDIYLGHFKKTLIELNQFMITANQSIHNTTLLASCRVTIFAGYSWTFKFQSLTSYINFALTDYINIYELYNECESKKLSTKTQVPRVMKWDARLWIHPCMVANTTGVLEP